MSDALNLSLLLARGWIGIVMFAHGWKHVQALRSGPGMARWLESLGLRFGGLQAQLLTWSEVAVGPLLVLGLLTPAAYGVVVSLMLVAFVTNHRDKGFFVTARPTEGWEYVMSLAVLSTASAAVGPGEWSLDGALDLGLAFDPEQALGVVAVVGIGGTIAYLGTFWRPAR